MVSARIGGPVEGQVCIVIDVLRASSTIVTMLERGCERVVAAAHVDEARELRERLPDHLLCGEAGGLPPEGFDYGNSPLEFSGLDLRGKSAILATTNGTRALADVVEAGAAKVLVGCLLNRTAVAEAARTMAREQKAGVVIACAGDIDSSEEDYAVGRSIAALLEGRTLEADVAQQVRDSRHAQALRRLGLEADVVYCAQADLSQVVPLLTVENSLRYVSRLPQT